MARPPWTRPSRKGPPLKKRIAIVEDEPAIRDNYAEALMRQGYTVEAHADRSSAMLAFKDRMPDLVIIDVGLGDEVEGGFDLCRDLRARSAALPIIFLTARDSDLDAVSGLRLGADDYLTKDISLPHLVARVVALFRRLDALGARGDGESIIRRGPLELDPERLAASWDDNPMELTVTEFWLIHALARRPGHVKSRDRLMEEANIVVDDATITSHIKRIRHKFKDIDPAFDAIDTVHGAGYRWKA